MSTKNDYSEADWNAISAAPFLAGLFVSLADASGPTGLEQEAIATGTAVTAAVPGDAPEIVNALADDLASRGQPPLPAVPRVDPVTMRAAIVTEIIRAVDVVERTSPAEAEAFKRWLVSVAVAVSRASKEGAVLGLGGTLVSDQETDALRELAQALGVRPPA